MKKVVVTIEVAEADVDETIIYLKYVKKQMERHTNMRISKVFVENEAVDNDQSKSAENFEKNHQHILRDIRNLLDEDVSNLGQMFFEDMKKAPSAKGAIVKLTPKV